jgi:hypothetical protein
MAVPLAGLLLLRGFKNARAGIARGGDYCSETKSVEAR